MIDQRIQIKVALEFTRMPGPRYRREGPFSGEQFLQELLRPRYLEARAADTKLTVDLDGAVGYPSSFLEQAFGDLAREFGSAEVAKRIEIVCEDEPYISEQVAKYIRDANKKR